MNINVKLVVMCVFVLKYAAASSVDGLTFTLAPNKTHIHGVINITCSVDNRNVDITTDVMKNSMIVVEYIGENKKFFKVPGTLETDMNTKRYIGSYKMNVRHDVDFECSLRMVINKEERKKLHSWNKLTYLEDSTVPPTPPPTLLSTPVYMSDQYTESRNNDEKEGSTNYIIYGAIGGSVALIFFLILAILCKVFKKPADKRRNSNATYENLINDGTGVSPTPPFPRGAKLEETYLAPADCMESPYATVGNDNATYAQPYKPKIEDLYSKPVPKTDRIDKNALYSQVLPKSQRQDANVTYADVGFDRPSKNKFVNLNDDNYAEVVDNGVNSKRNDVSDYSNVFVNEPYYNSKDAKSDDYAEPAYCQVNRK